METFKIKSKILMSFYDRSDFSGDIMPIFCKKEPQFVIATHNCTFFWYLCTGGICVGV